MDVSIKFLGAAQSVTGSKYLVQVDRKKILVDCGMFQGQKELRLRNWSPLPIDPKEIDIVIITHAHIDHIGYLPRLVKDGYKGKIICTSATEDLMSIMLLDAAKLQEEEALFAIKRGYSKHAKPEPLFDEQDAKAVLTLAVSQSMKKEFFLVPGVTASFHNAGHILGAAFIQLHLKGQSQSKTITFSGDLGRYEDPILYPPDALPPTDVLLVESTYGDRVNPMGEVENHLSQIVEEAYSHEGVLVIPAFALGRTQSLIYYLIKLMQAKRIPLLPIYIDSPMAINVTNLYERHSELHKIPVTKEHNELISIFDSPNIHYCNTRESSQALNTIKKPAIIISASGMATGGRILHHLSHRLPNENDTVLFAGYQAEGSRGRKMLEGEPTIRIFGKDIPVKCHVRELHGLSAHADQTELLKWIGTTSGAPKHTFITHGELASATTFAGIIKEKSGWNTFIPQYLETVEIFKGI